MKTLNFYSELSALSAEATRFARYRFSDQWSVVARSSGFEFIYADSTSERDKSFFIRLNSDRVPIMELPPATINVSAAGMSSNYHFYGSAFALVQDVDYLRGILLLVGKLCDLLDDYPS